MTSTSTRRTLFKSKSIQHFLSTPFVLYYKFETSILFTSFTVSQLLFTVFQLGIKYEPHMIFNH